MENSKFKINYNIPYFGNFGPWFIIGLIRHLDEKANNKLTKNFTLSKITPGIVN